MTHDSIWSWMTHIKKKLWRKKRERIMYNYKWDRVIVLDNDLMIVNWNDFYFARYQPVIHAQLVDKCPLVKLRKTLDESGSVLTESTGTHTPNQDHLTRVNELSWLESIIILIGLIKRRCRLWAWPHGPRSLKMYHSLNFSAYTMLIVTSLEKRTQLVSL